MVIKGQIRESTIQCGRKVLSTPPEKAIIALQACITMLGK